MTFSTRTLSLVSAAIVVALAGGGIYLRLRPDEAQAGAAQAPGAGEAPGAPPTSASQQFSTGVPQPVAGSPARLDTLWVQVTAAGQAEAFREATLTARVEGQVAGVSVAENDRVEAGATLVRIDTTEYALEVAKARSELERAESEYQKLVLFDQAIEDADVRADRARISRAQSGLTAAEVGLRQAEIDLERTAVLAPFGGRIADLEAVAGQWVAADAELLTLVDLEPIKVEVRVLEAELGLLSEGRRAVVSFAAFPGEEFEGRIRTVNPRVDPESRTGRVTVLLENRDGRIKPGMYAQVTIDARAFADRVLIPRRALLERDGRLMVFVFNAEGESGRAEWRYVTTGRENEVWVELTRGDEGFVEPGEVVLTDGHHYLAHDAMVRLVDDPASEGGRPGR